MFPQVGSPSRTTNTLHNEPNFKLDKSIDEFDRKHANDVNNKEKAGKPSIMWRDKSGPTCTKSTILPITDSSGTQLEELRSLTRKIREWRLRRYPTKHVGEKIPPADGVIAAFTPEPLVVSTNSTAETTIESSEKEPSSPIARIIIRRSRVSELKQRICAKFQQSLLDKLHDVNMLLLTAIPGSDEEQEWQSEKEDLIDYLRFSRKRTPKSLRKKDSPNTRQVPRKYAPPLPKKHGLEVEPRQQIDAMKTIVRRVLTESSLRRSIRPEIHSPKKQLGCSEATPRDLILADSDASSHSMGMAERGSHRIRVVLDANAKGNRLRGAGKEIMDRHQRRECKSIPRKTFHSYKQPEISPNSFGTDHGLLCHFYWDYLDPFECDAPSSWNYTDGDFRPNMTEENIWSS